MPYKHVSSDSALETSVAILRDGIGPAVSKAFVIAPLWVPGVGCVGLVVLADIPYARQRTNRRYKQRTRQHIAEEPCAARRRGANPRCPYVVGAGVVEFAKRVGMALGGAVHRIRKRTVLAAITAEVGDHIGDNETKTRAADLSLRRGPGEGQGQGAASTLACR